MTNHILHKHKNSTKNKQELSLAETIAPKSAFVKHHVSSIVLKEHLGGIQ